VTTALVALALAAALVLGGVTAAAVLLLAVLLAQGLFVAGWFPALRATGATGGRIVVVATAVGADAAVLAADDTRPLEHVAPVLALALLAALAHQLFRRDGRVELTASLTATGAAAVLAALGSAWLALDVSRDGTGLLVLAAVAAAAPSALDLAAATVKAPRWAGVLAAVLVTGLAAVAVAAAATVTLTVALAAAAAGAVAARLGVVLADRAAVPHPLLGAALPALLVAPAVYLIGRVLTG
jgi:hypothetical protein